MSEFESTDLFEPATREQWLQLVDKVLKGGDFEKRLVSRTSDGVRLAPLYTRADILAQAETAAPGRAPFTRGKAVGSGNWDIRQRHAEPDPARANKALLEDLAGGVSSIELQIAAPGWFGLPYTGEALAQALEGVMLDVCPVILQAGEYTADAAGSLMALWRARGIPESGCVGGFNADPLGTLAATGALYHPVARSLQIAAQLAADSLPMPGVTALLADGRVYHAGGATEAQELAAVLATVAAYLRALEEAGVPPETALPKIAVTLAVDANQFLGLAKLRAARRLIWRLADACGAGAAVARVPFAAETSVRMMARRDPWVNMLRTTMACATAAMACADAITVLPFTWVLGRPDAFARRIARNTQLVLMEESGLARVTDPAGGSWAVESITEDLARRAWEMFQAIETKGGMAAALTSGFIQDEIDTAAEARARLAATGRLEMTGTSAFPMLGDDGVKTEPWPSDILSADLKGATVRPLRVQRLAEPFEVLRDAADAFARTSGQPPRVFLAPLGTLASHSTRSTWAQNFLAAGGVAAVTSEGYADAAQAAHAFSTSGATIACISGSDQDYAEHAEAMAKALKAAGAKQVLLAGRPDANDAKLRTAGVDDFIYAGCDRVGVLKKLHVALGVMRTA
jgi:methylmalonyl-CoA mutase